MTDCDYLRPQHHSTTWLAAHKLTPALGLRHTSYQPSTWSVCLTRLTDLTSVYLNGTPAELHNLALALLAAADEAAAAEGAAQRAEDAVLAAAARAHVADWALAELAEDDVERDRWTTGDPSPIDLL